MRTSPWQPGHELHPRHTDSKPACLRQPVRRGSGCNSVQRPLRVRLLLLGISFFSYRQLELGFRYVDHLVVELYLNLCL